MSSATIPPKPPQAQAEHQNEPPSQTLYVKNLDDKLNKTDLRRELYMLASTYGHVLDVVALKSKKMRGQAHIVYRDTQTSFRAKQELDNCEFFGREMRVSFARGRSDIVSRLSGTAKAPEPPKSAAPANAASDLQKSVFAAPPGSAAAAPPLALGAPPSLAPKPAGLKAVNGVTAEEGAKSPLGVKRPREEESEEEDASMEEDDDEDEEMDVSDDDE